MKCNKCGAKVERYPLRDEKGKLIIKNLFKMDIVSILMLIAVILMTIGYVNDVNQYKWMAEHPCEYAASTGCCNFIEGNTFIPDKAPEQFNPKLGTTPINLTDI